MSGTCFPEKPEDAAARPSRGTAFPQLVAARNLPAAELADQLRQRAAGASHGRTDRPVWHVHLDPDMGHDHPETISAFLLTWSGSFGLEDSDRCGVLHTKNGRTHAHVVYSLVQRTAVLPTSKTHTVDVRNALSSPLAIGLPVPPIPRPASVYRALVKEGHPAAEWMRQHCDLDRPLQVAAFSEG
jgi:hypothetical protein